MKIKNLKDIGKTEDRKIAISIIEKGIESVLPENVINNNVKLESGILKIQDKEFNLEDYNKIFIIGFGKASYQMAESINNLLGDKIEKGYVNSNINKKIGKIEVIEAGHPIPNKKGMEGAKNILSIKTGKKDLVICLISGGGSSMLALPEEGITLEDLQSMNDIFVKAGSTIQETNTVRKHISQVKGGKLAAKLQPATIISLIISDVVGDDLSVIASGPTSADKTTFKESIEIIEKYGLTEILPSSILEHLKTGLEETIKEGDEILENVHNFIIANNRVALDAMKKEAEKHGLKAEIITSSLEGDVIQVGRYIANEITNAESDKALIFGGETTVTVKGTGTGGRNQELLLSIIENIKNQDVTIAAIGTDGIDFFEVAGAIIDGESYQKSAELELNITEYLNNNDSYNFFKKMNDQIITGHTGTNVGDIILGVKR
ncbi:MAG: DUF4147 domain-containing protein [Nanoarchaeota archaeon]|nr:DUF4147 domain-containing protein [Nanoarchaeota archaeon]